MQAMSILQRASMRSPMMSAAVPKRMVETRDRILHLPMHVFRRRPFSLQSFANAAQAQPAEYAIPTLSKSASSPRKMATPKPAKSTIRRVGVGAIAVDGSSSTMSGNVASRLRSVEPLPEREAAVHSRCVAQCTARQYDMHRLRTVLNDRGFTVTERKRTEDYVHARVPAPASGEVFAFKDGAVVCWDMAEGEVQRLRSYLRLVEADRYDEELVDSEEMAVTYGRGRDTGIVGEDIIIGEVHGRSPEDEHYIKLAFSHGLSRSIQLGVLENHLAKYLESIEHIPIHMMKRRRINFNARDLMAKHGQLLYIRGLLNLHTDLVDNVPEFYWSRADLAKHFESISRTLDVLPRIKVLNQRLDHADRVVDLMRDQMSKNHGTRMELIIIWLILVEVIFETVHYLNELKYVDLYALAGNHRGHPFLPWRRKTDSDDGNAGDNIGKAVTMVDAMSESESELDHQLGDSVALN